PLAVPPTEVPAWRLLSPLAAPAGRAARRGPDGEAIARGVCFRDRARPGRDGAGRADAARLWTHSPADYRIVTVVNGSRGRVGTGVGSPSPNRARPIRRTRVKCSRCSGAGVPRNAVGTAPVCRFGNP